MLADELDMCLSMALGACKDHTRGLIDTKMKLQKKKHDQFIRQQKKYPEGA